MKIGTDPADLPTWKGTSFRDMYFTSSWFTVFNQICFASLSTHEAHFFASCLFKKKGRPQASIGGVKFSNLMQFVVH